MLRALEFGPTAENFDHARGFSNEHSLYAAETRTMTHLIRKSFIRTTALLSIFGAVTTGNAWDEVETPAAEPIPAAAVANPKTIYTLPSLKPLWEAQAVINATRDKVVQVALDEEVVFVQSSAGVVTAINADSGRQYWSAQIGRNDEVAMKGSSDNQTVVIAVGPVLHAFDKFSGQKLFSHRMPVHPSGAPLLARREVSIGNHTEVTRSIFVPLADKSLIAYNAENLEYLGKLGTLKPGVSRAMDWRFSSGDMILLKPVAGQERLAFATNLGNIHVVDMSGAAKGKTRFQFLMNSKATAPLVVATREDDEYLLAACDNNRFFCIDLKTDGRMIWTIPMSSPVFQPISVVGDDVFVVSSDRLLQKFNLVTGVPATVSEGGRAIASQSEDGASDLPTYGAAVEMRCDGVLAFEPVRVLNRSTGQMINSLVINLEKATQGLTFGVDDQNVHAIRVSERSEEETGLISLRISDDRKTLTADFTDFNPGEVFEFYIDLEHPEIPGRLLTHRNLTGATLRALVSPVRASVIAIAAADRRVEPLPPRAVVGRFSEVFQPWQVPGVKSLVSITQNTVYFVDLNDRVVSVSRDRAGEAHLTPTRDYTIPINNTLTDRVFLSTASGRVACFTEARVEIGGYWISAFGLPSWFAYPKTELEPDFPVYHRNPDARPIMPDVPAVEPEAPASSDDAQEMP